MERFINSADNAEYILIPGGSYIMGELNKEVTVKAFYLAKYPVTNQQYRKFIDNTRHRQTNYWVDRMYNGDDQPVVGVSWDDAVAYCNWLGKMNREKYEFRLPTEAEWEWAAGRGERKYPWGNEKPNHNRANYDNKVGRTTPVGIYPAGATPDVLMDMAGNVWEWTASDYDFNKYQGDMKVLHGGSYCSVSDFLGCSVRGWGRPILRDNDFGFRVVCVPPGDLGNLTLWESGKKEQEDWIQGGKE